MFSEIPKLFDRNFALGYFLPTAAFVASSLWLASWIGVIPKINIVNTDPFIGTTLLGLLSWLLGILILALNRQFYRVLEGYGSHNPVRVFLPIEQNRFRRLQKDVTASDEEFWRCENAGIDLPTALRATRNQRIRQASERFPDRYDLLLPTPFGNAMRAFEIYPRAMYGIDAIEGWIRLIAVVPKDYRDLIDAAKAQTDFWVNSVIFALLLEAEYLFWAVHLHPNKLLLTLWFPATVFLLMFTCLSAATRAAIEWGTTIKSAFDVFLPDLITKMGYVYPPNNDELRSLCRALSQAMIYRLPETLPIRQATEQAVDPNNAPALPQKRRSRGRR